MNTIQRLPMIVASSALLMISNQLYAQDNNIELKYQIQQSLNRASPMTLFGPITSDALNITESAETYSVEVENPRLFGFIPLSELSFDLQADQADSAQQTYQVHNVTYPSVIHLPNNINVNIGDHEIEGLWSFDSFSYQTLNATFRDLSVSVEGLEQDPVSINEAQLTINANDQANLGIALSEMTIHPIDRLTPDRQTYYIQEMNAQLNAEGQNADEPIDLHQILSDYITLQTINQNYSQAQTLLVNLAKKDYELINIALIGSGIHVETRTHQGDEDMRLDDFTASFTLENINPENWGSATLSLYTKNLQAPVWSDAQKTALEEAAPYIDSASMEEEIQYGYQLQDGQLNLVLTNYDIASMVEFIQFITKDNYSPQIQLSKIYDAFLGHDELDVRFMLEDLTMANDIDALQHIDHLDLATTLSNFRGKTEATFSTALDVKNFRTFTILNSDEYAPSELQQLTAQDALLQSYVPHTFNVNQTVNNLHIDTLYRLAEESLIDRHTPERGLTLLPFIANMEPKIAFDHTITSDKMGMQASGDYQFAPLSMLGSSPKHRGNIDVELSGLDAYERDITNVDYYFLTPKDTRILFESLASVYKAYATQPKEKTDTHIWNIVIEPSLTKADIHVNGTPFHINTIPSVSTLSPLMLFMFLYGL